MQDRFDGAPESRGRDFSEGGGQESGCLGEEPGDEFDREYNEDGEEVEEVIARRDGECSMKLLFLSYMLNSLTTFTPYGVKLQFP